MHSQHMPSIWQWVLGLARLHKFLLRPLRAAGPNGPLLWLTSVAADRLVSQSEVSVYLLIFLLGIQHCTIQTNEEGSAERCVVGRVARADPIQTLCVGYREQTHLWHGLAVFATPSSPT